MTSELRQIMLYEAREAEKDLIRHRRNLSKCTAYERPKFLEYVGHAERRLARVLSRLRELNVEEREWTGLLKTLRGDR